MSLNERIRELVGAAAPHTAITSLTLEELRARTRAQITILRKAGVREYEVETCEDRSLSVCEGTIPVRVYRPSRRRSLPLVLYFPGGGWVLSDLDTHDGICRAISHISDAVVLSVDYRKAPEHRFPTALNDCTAAAEWATTHLDELGADPGAIFVAGDSAGGNLAAVLALESRTSATLHFAGQILIYPAVDSPEASYPSINEFHPDNDHGQSRELYLRFIDLYLGSNTDRNNPRFAPMRAKDLAKAPPALIITAKYDLLRDEAEAYARRLLQEGSQADLRRYDDVNHGFLHLPGIVPAADNAFALIANWISARCPGGR